MSFIDVFKESTAWSVEYDLPIVPRASNPWIYMAYAMKIIAHNGSDISQVALRKYWEGCQNTDGTMNRKPDGSGGVLSYDEMIGASYLSSEYAEVLYQKLDANDWEYNNKPESEKSDIPERFNNSRFIFFKPFMRAATLKRRVSLYSQAVWCLFLIPDFFKPESKQNAGDLLKKWLMLETMERWPLCEFVIILWRMKMKAIGVGPKWCFSRYLTEEPVFRNTAKDSF